MITSNLNKLELNEFIGTRNTLQQCKATFPLFGAHGTQELATVYFEIEPGHMLGRHTDSAEELLVILQGEVKAEVDGETSWLTAGGLLIVPRMAPHNLFNIGVETVKVLGVFGGANQIVAEFEESWLPMHSHRVDTSQLA